MSKIQTSCLKFAVTIVALMCLPGCMPFADSAAMRIEVEVYKGPLSLEPEIQVSELYGYLVEAENGMIGILEMAQSIPQTGRRSWLSRTDLGRSLIHIVIEDSSDLIVKLHRAICSFDKSSEDCEIPLPQDFQNIMKAAHSGVQDALTDEKARKVAVEIVAHLRELYRKANKEKGRKVLALANKLDPGVLADISRTAAAMQAAAFRYATMSETGTPFDAAARVAATLFTVAASEYGNQIEARADALLKQFGEHGRDRRELPLSTHLREAEPTDFVHLFDWADGHIPRLLDYITFDFKPNVDERIKILERLYADHFWSKINTVYASGRGKTQMAFIKDETGNWNLKSFDNDPTELLEAYSETTKSAIKGVAKVAESMATGGASEAQKQAISQLLALADRTNPDKKNNSNPSPGTLTLTHLRERLSKQLNAELVSAGEVDDKLVKAVEENKDDIVAKQALQKYRKQTVEIGRDD